MNNAEQDYYAEIVELRAELEQVRGERDALAHWRQKFHELAAENTRLESERDQYIERCEELQTVQLRMVEELAMVEGAARVAREERDAARAVAATLRKWGVTWREIAWGYELADEVQIFDNQRQLWSTSRPRDCMGRRLNE